LDFFSANEHKQFISVRHFLEQASFVMKAQSEKKCERKELPEELLGALINELNLWMEGNTDALHHHAHFSEWYSQRLDDSWFGSKGNPLCINLTGCNTYLNLIDEQEELTQKLFVQVLSHLDSLDPVRIVIVGKADVLGKLAKDRRIFELAIIEDDLKFPSTICILLALNKSSMVVDPISWSSVVAKLYEWRDISQIKLVIPATTDTLFRERTLPSHRPRVRAIQMENETFVYSLFGPPSQLGQSTHSRIPITCARLIHKVNQFDQSLLLLGIVPNQLRKIAKDHKMEHVDEFLLLLSDVLFWEGYELWKKRKALVMNYWKNIAPKEWKVDAKEKKSRGKRKMLPNCKNPFHYCVKHCDLSQQRATPCLCSDVVHKLIPKELPDIRCFLTKFPKRYWRRLETPISIIKITAALSREDLIRGAHDRGKKKSKKKVKK
jgi:hypothetical protein